MVLSPHMGDLVKIRGNGITFYIDSSQHTHKIYFSTNVQCMRLDYIDSKRRDVQKMNLISSRITSGDILDLNTLCGGIGKKITFKPSLNYELLRNIL